MRNVTARLVLLAVCGGGAWVAASATAEAQNPDGDSRAPRFLVASSASPSRAVPVDVREIPVLHRRLSLNLNNVSLKAALTTIAHQAGLNLAYTEDVVPERGGVHLRADGITVAAALTDVLMDTNIDVVFLPEGRAVLRKRTPAVSPASGMLLGRVTDAKTGQRLPGVDVFLGDTHWRTTTDSGGWYRLAGVDSGSYALMARRIGYAQQSRRVVVREALEDTVNLALEPVAAKLDELVTTATGRQRRRDLGNRITTINADSVMEHAPIKNLTDLLQNRVPGLTVQHSSGAPGDPARLRLRGLNSVQRSNDPVVVVDGVRVYAAQSAARSGNLTGGVPAPSPLDQIDPNTIETVEVFNGASAATLYGADAANGVIVITTKRGKPGPTRWSASVMHGRENRASRYPVGYYRWGHLTVDPLNPGYTRFCMITVPGCVTDSLVQFQALNEPNLTPIGQGHRTALTLTASGGTQALTYSMTGSYTTELGGLKLPTFEIDRFRTRVGEEAPDWMRRPHRYDTWAVSSNVTARLSAVADLGLTTTLSRSEQERTDLEQRLGSMMATYVDTVNGIYYGPGGNNYGLGGLGNPTDAILRDYYHHITASTITFTAGLNAIWHPRSWLSGSAQAGLNVVPRNDVRFMPSGFANPLDTASGEFTQGVGRSLVSTFNVQGTLRKPLRHGLVFETNIGANLTTTNTSDLITTATGLVSGVSAIGQRINGLITASNPQSNTSVYGWYLEPRISGQRISLSTGLRLDGGSAYGTRISGTNGGSFLRNLISLPRLGGSWVISEEPWFPFPGFFSSLRLRGAYGQAQVQPGPADRLRLYSGNTTPTSVAHLSSLGNTQLVPERSAEFEGGFDADLLDSRVSLEVTGFRKKQIDALMPVTLPSSVDGGGSVLKNIGNIQNTGLEVTLGVTPVRSALVNWSAQLVYQRTRNLLTKLGRGVEPNPDLGLVEGYPVFSRWAFPILGFVDHNGNGLLERDEILIGDTKVFMGRLEPASESSLHTNLALFRNAVTVMAVFSYQAGAMQKDMLANTNWVLLRALVDPTVPFGQQAAVIASQKLLVGNIEVSPATDYGLLQQVSTFRFQSLSVNYQAPQRVARLLLAQRLTVAVQGSNLGFHSTYRGRDPDVNAWAPGEQISDTGQLPQPRIWQLALYLTF